MAEMKLQIAELSTLMRAQLAAAPLMVASAAPVAATVAAPTVPVNVLANCGPTQVNNGSVVNNNTVTQITLRSWRDPEDRVVIPTSMLRAAFTENARLAEYCRMTDEDKTNPEGAAPFVLEALMELVKRAHADPAARNVYLNPKRADQVLVFDETSWKVVALVDAIRDIFDSVAGNIGRVIRQNMHRTDLLPFEVQASAAWIPSMYNAEQEEYVKKAKTPMAAHLANTSPAQVAPLLR